MSRGSVNLGSLVNTGLNAARKDKELKKAALQYWLKYGSLARAAEEMNKDGLTTRAGKKFTYALVRKYAYNFLVEFPDDARKVYQAFGEFPNTESGDREWLVYIISRAVRHPVLSGKNNFLLWAAKKGLYKPGFKLFQHTFNLKDDDYDAFG